MTDYFCFWTASKQDEIDQLHSVLDEQKHEMDHLIDVMDRLTGQTPG